MKMCFPFSAGLPSYLSGPAFVIYSITFFFGVVALQQDALLFFCSAFLFSLYYIYFIPCAVFSSISCPFFLQMSGLLHLHLFQPFSSSSVKGMVHLKLKFHPFTTHPGVDGDFLIHIPIFEFHGGKGFHPV